MSEWKVLEERNWENFDAADPRVGNIEQISLVAVLIAGFAVSDLSGFRQEDFTSPWGVVYVALMANVVGLTMFMSVVGALTVVTATREAVWDRQLAAWIQTTDARSFDEAKQLLANCPSYMLATTALRKLARFNCTPRTRFHIGDEDLGIPFSRRTVSLMTDFNATPLGFARANFPWAILCYLGAVSIKLAQRFNSIALFIGPLCLVAWGISITYYSSHLLTILGHSNALDIKNHLDGGSSEKGSPVLPSDVP